MLIIGFALMCVFLLFLLMGLYTRGKITFGNSVAIVVSLVIFLLGAKLTMRAMLPSYSDTAVIEVTGEKSEESSGCDIGISAIQVGGKKMDLGGRDIDRGTWLYDGSSLTWGYTPGKTVSFLVPCYSKVDISFVRNMWAGKVKIALREVEDSIDCFAANASGSFTVTYTINRAGWKEIAGKMLPVALVLLIEFLLVFCVALSLIPPKLDAIQKCVKKCTEQLKKEPYFWLRLSVVVIAFVTMMLFAGKWSLWADDLATLDFVAEDIPLRMNIVRILDEAKYNPPLFYVLAYIWLRLMPFGTVYLKLLNILLCCAGIWLCGTAAKRISGDRAGLIATMFAATSFFLITYAAYTFRSFGLLFALCPLLIIAYHKRLSEPDRIINYVLYGLVHALLLYTNYICGLITAIFGLYDLWLYARNKINLKFLWSYIGAGLSFLPLILYVMSAMIESHQSFWPSVPNLGVLLDTILQIFSNKDLIFILFIFSTFLVITFKVKKINEGGKIYSETAQEAGVILVLWFLFVLGFSYIFSRYLYPNSSIFVARYFISALTPGLILAAIGADFLVEILCQSRKSIVSGILTAALIFSGYAYLEFNCLSEVYACPGFLYEPYEEAINWICGHEDAYQGRCLVMVSGYQGGLYYYATQGGKRPNLNFGSLTETNMADYDVIYVSPQHGGISSTVLDTYYEEVERRDDLRVIKYRKK